MSIKFDKDIPVPNKRAFQKYCFEIMEVGDSFAVSEAERAKIYAASYAHGKKYNKGFTVRKYEDAYRCWRIN